LSQITNGKSLQPLSGAAPGKVVLLLHGYGSSGDDLISLARHWQHLLPDALFVAPNAPQRCGFGFGYQWWALDNLAPHALAAGAAVAAPSIEAFLDRKLDQYGLADADVAIVGFSQGTMMALQVGLRRPRAVAAILGYSGALTGAGDLPGQIKSKPPVLLIHGSADQIVPVAALHAAARALNAAGVDVRAHISPGLGHSVDETGLNLGAQFLAEKLGDRPAPTRSAG